MKEILACVFLACMIVKARDICKEMDKQKSTSEKYSNNNQEIEG